VFDALNLPRYARQHAPLRGATLARSLLAALLSILLLATVILK
jgi:hypothetical protein